MARSIQVAKNVLSGFLGQIITLFLGFATRTIFIHTLTAEYLGVSGLFTSLLSVLNLSELGIGVSITYSLYKPLAGNDKEAIKSLMTFYKKAYRIIGFVVLCVGLALMPFLDKLISGITDLVNVRIVFLLYIGESVSSYWLYAYKRTLLEANQQKYIVSLLNSLTSGIVSLLRITALLVLRKTPILSFYAYIVIGIIGQLLNNVLIGRKVDKQFDYLSEKNNIPLTKAQKTPIFKNVAGVFVSKLSGIMLTSVDNILISAFISVSQVGIYSNYIVLKSCIIMPIGIVFDSITASIGDFCARESVDRQEAFFETIQFTYFWIYGFCSICMWILFNPFIGGIWINREYLMSDTAVFLIVANFLLDGLSGAVIKFRDAHGLYWQAKYRYLFSALFNGVISYVLIRPLGVEGVLLGTTASIVIMISLDPFIVYKNVFKKNPIRYYLNYSKYLLITVATGILVSVIVAPFDDYSFLNFVIKCVVCLVVPNALWFLIFRKNTRFNYLKGYAKTVWDNMQKIVLSH